MREALRSLVEIESPSGDEAGLARAREWVSERLSLLGIPAEVDARSGALGFLAFPDPGKKAEPVLAVAHLDTVWPRGTLAKRPFREDGERAWGPGTFDTKCGVVLLLSALEALREEGVRAPRPILGFLSVDEETSSLRSRDRVKELARTARAALVLEPALGEDGKAKTARKGGGRYRVLATGKSAHAGLEPEKGASAIHELAFQVTRIHGLADRSRGTTLNVGKIEGGLASNVVAPAASCEVDARALTASEAERIDAALKGLSPVLEGTSLRVEGGFERPPLARTEAVAALYGLARGIASDLGFPLGEATVGGGSDGSHTAPLVATLDGLGAVGDGAHAEHEHVVLSWLPRRAALLASLLVSFP